MHSALIPFKCPLSGKNKRSICSSQCFKVVLFSSQLLLVITKEGSLKHTLAEEQAQKIAFPVVLMLTNCLSIKSMKKESKKKTDDMSEIFITFNTELKIEKSNCQVLEYWYLLEIIGKREREKCWYNWNPVNQGCYPMATIFCRIRYYFVERSEKLDNLNPNY